MDKRSAASVSSDSMSDARRSFGDSAHHLVDLLNVLSHVLSAGFGALLGADHGCEEGAETEARLLLQHIALRVGTKPICMHAYLTHLFSC